MDPKTAPALPDAWRELFDRLATLPDHPEVQAALADAPSRAEGYRFLARTLAYELTSALTASDPAAPAFVRLGDGLSRGTAPNPDNICRRATIAADGVYRIHGTMGSCEDFILSITSGQWHEGTYRVHAEVTAADLGIGPGQDIDIVLAADTREGPWVPLEDGIDAVQIREYYFAEADTPPATFVVERVDTAGRPPPPMTEDDLARLLAATGEQITSFVSYWVRVGREQQGRGVPNHTAPPVPLAGGASRIRYGSTLVDVADDEALLFTFEQPQGPSWGLQLSSVPWGETVDEGGRSCSLNHRSAHVDRDGRVRVVISARDPGTPNWVDTAGHAPVRVLYRWIGATNEPVPVSTVVPLAALRDHLPADTPVVDSEARRRRVARRQRHLVARTRA